ncbi:MAG TPA: phosphate signaling complex protein PhoU [Actinomycetales bacterium]|nr:phosphate signaling complex protein PhoU [Actinomycetales bacterium]
MRSAFHQELDHLADSLVEMADLVGTAMGEATRALLEPDLALAEKVISGDAAIDALQRQLDNRAVVLLAQQQPVATDLRVVVSTLRMSMTLERMGDLARHVAQVARLRYPKPAVPEQLRTVVARMGEVAEAVAHKASEVIRTRDLALAAQLEQDDDELDELHRQMFSLLVELGAEVGPGAIVDVTLLSRYFERFGDHAVNIAQRVEFLVTGEEEPATTNR